MAKGNKKIIKYKAPFRLNLGVIVFLVIFIYLGIQIFRSLNIKDYSIYEVNSSYIDTNIHCTGIALRNETLIDSSESGYVSYYIRDGEKVAKNSAVYTVDETGSMYDMLNDAAADNTTFSAENYTEIRNRISMFNTYFDNMNYSEIYNFKYDIENVVLEMSNELLVDSMTSMTNNALDTFNKATAPESGIVTYYKDGFEGVSPEQITSTDFNKDKYNKETLKTGEIISAGNPVYKLTTSEAWNIVIPLSKEDVERLTDTTWIKIRINNSEKTVYASLTILNQGDDNYGCLALDKLQDTYISDRYLDIEVIMDSNKGLKIPNSSIVKKDVYVIPASFLTTGSNSDTNTFINVRQLDENGEITVKQVEPTIYKTDEENGTIYINPLDFEDNAVIVANDSTTTLALNDATKETLEGVYCVNKGYATFKYINIIYQDSDYSVVSPNINYGISLYDRIILDCSLIDENAMIH